MKYVEERISCLAKYMRRLMIFGVIYTIGFVISVILIVKLAQTSLADISWRLMGLTLLVSFWLLMEALSYPVPKEWIFIFQRLKYLGVILVAPVLLITSINFIKKDYRLGAARGLLIYFIPLLSLASAFTNRIPYRFITAPRVSFLDKVPIYSYTKDIGFIINMAYSYLLIVVACCLLFIRAMQSPRIYRRQSMFVFFGCSASFVINLLFVTQNYVLIPIDTTPLMILATLAVFYWGVFHLPKSMIVPYARDLVIENIKDLILVVDNNKCIIDVNPVALELIQRYSQNIIKSRYTKNKLIGMGLDELSGLIPQIKELQSRVLKNEDKIMQLQEGGRSSYYALSSEEIYDSDKRRIGMLYLLHDITQMKEQMNHLLELNKSLAVSDMVINNALEGIVITDTNNTIIRVNDSIASMSGYSKEELIGRNPRIMKSDKHDAQFYREMWEQLYSKGVWEGEIWDRKKSGELYPKWMSIITIYDSDGAVTNYIGISSDITKMKQAEDDIQLLAYYDPLTGIPNRTLLYDRLRTALARSVRNGTSVSLFFMDIDRFKYINDSLGHDVGDQLLVEVSKRIKSILRETDTLFRLGGDEFTLILDNSKEEEAILMAERIVNAINEPFLISDRMVNISISIGIAIAPHDDLTVEGMIRKADSAMYHAKETGRGKYAFSSEEIERRNYEWLEMQIKLKEALQQEEFLLYLQPQIAYCDGRNTITGAEALIRWKREGRLIPPDVFIPASEENGLILPIGNWVIQEIFRLDRILKEHGIQLELAFNVSVKQFENTDLIQLLRQMMQDYSSQEISLTVEITESMFINNLEEAIRYLNEIRELGIRIALDDFGTGYSSLSILTKLPVDILKIDKSFIDSLEDCKHRNLTDTIISMAKIFKLKTLAEGVETREQAQALIARECDEQQGYYYSRPLPVEEFIAFYREWDSLQKYDEKNLIYK
jgi:diguanylate cyclase (GGDEF)-like protein/PAS domain S-box-containing protein